ncbi:hypothetical protein C1646_727128 [Rhizophagus diaphanus]|nr:hypothetical protein C1646_727128 [Rhizophagus diaphanus] [Rhizophagus sp. MUCL 43196]
MEVNNLISKLVISTTAAQIIVSEAGSAAIPIGGGAIMIGLQEKNKKLSKFMDDVFLFTGIITLCIVPPRTIEKDRYNSNHSYDINHDYHSLYDRNHGYYSLYGRNHYDSHEESKFWKIAKLVISRMVSIMVTRKIVSKTGLAAIPIGGVLMTISSHVSGLVGEILYTVGCDTLTRGILRDLSYFGIEFIDNETNEITRSNRE